MTREMIRKRVLGKLINDPDSSDPSFAALVYQALDLRLKEMHKLGNLWWQIAPAATNVTITSSVATATSPLTMLYPITFMAVDGSREREIEIIDHRTFHELKDKASLGYPTKAYFDNGTIYLYPIPNANITAKLTFEAIAEDTASGLVPDIPVEMMRSLIALLCYDLSDDFALPEPTIQRMAVQAEQAEKTIRKLNARRVANKTTRFKDY